jgi:hypothetical protein
VHIKFTWHLDSRGVVHTTHTVQSWQLQGTGWVLAGERHLRGEPMPGVPPRPENTPEDTPENTGDDDAGEDHAGEGAAGEDDMGPGDSGEDEPAGSHGDALRPRAE